jgi:hypothetical protein
MKVYTFVRMYVCLYYAFMYVSIYEHTYTYAAQCVRLNEHIYKRFPSCGFLRREFWLFTDISEVVATSNKHLSVVGNLLTDNMAQQPKDSYLHTCRSENLEPHVHMYVCM